MGGRRDGQVVGIYSQAAASIAESRPAIGFAENASCRKLARSKFLVAPKHIALRVIALGEQAIGKTYRLDCFAVKHGAYLDSAIVFKITEDEFRIDLVLGAVNHDFVSTLCSGVAKRLGKHGH